MQKLIFFCSYCCRQPNTYSLRICRNYDKRIMELSSGMMRKNLNNYFDFHVCLSFRLLRASVRLSENYLQFLQKYNKMSLIKVAWYVSCVKNMHFGSPSDPSQTAAAEAKPRCVYSILKPHGQSFRRQIRLLPSKATLREFQTKTFVHLPRVGPKQLCA